MTELRYTLVTDGVSDQALIPLLTWILLQYLPDWAIQSEWADLRRLPKPPKTLRDRIKTTIELYPCDLLFVHRDAERATWGTRVAEIREAEEEAKVAVASIPPVICVVPIRMQEAWLLFDEAALRRAAANPNGRERLELPRLRDLEALPDPKGRLYELIREASGLHGHRKKKKQVSDAGRLIATFVEDFSPLRELSAFKALEEDIQGIIRTQGWNSTL